MSGSDSRGWAIRMARSFLHRGPEDWVHYNLSAPRSLSPFSAVAVLSSAPHSRNRCFGFCVFVAAFGCLDGRLLWWLNAGPPLEPAEASKHCLYIRHRQWYPTVSNFWTAGCLHCGMMCNLILSYSNHFRPYVALFNSMPRYIPHPISSTI